MIDKKIIKSNFNDRLQEIDEMVDKLKPNDTINQLIKQWSNELKHYEYIDTVEQFSTLSLKGTLRYINRYDKKLRYGGLLVKIYQKDGDWIGIVKQSNNKKYYVSFKSNYIFYQQSKDDTLRSYLKELTTDIDNGKFIIE